MTLTTAPKTGHATFLYSELATDLDTLQAGAAVRAGYFDKPAS
ncbi:MAG TPA: hypothetical protein VIU82_04995 [Bosea sp. (in: a-proteobacteria)]